MKIVMYYEIGGGYECGTYEQTLCFEYESTEKFLLDFEEIILKGKAEREFVKRAWSEWEKTKPNVARLSLSSQRRELEEWNKSRPDCSCPSSFTFCGQEFDYTNFLGSEGSIELPEVYELEEWFNAKRLN